MNITKFISQHTWTVGFSFDGVGALLDNKKLNIVWLKNPYRDRWFADPFILNVTDITIELLVEEYYDPISRGRISRLFIDRRRMSIIKSVPILELDTHLSFPFICRRDDGVYIIPENYESGECKEYKYDVDKNTCIYNRTLVKKPLMDAVLTNLLGISYLVSTCYPSHETLHFFKEDSDQSDYLFFRNIKFSSNIARNAGSWFKYKGKYYRPAQDCEESYGKAVILQEVVLDEEGNIQMKGIRRIESTNPSYQLGCHTLNICDDIMVFDAKAYRFPRLRAIYQLLRKMLNR